MIEPRLGDLRIRIEAGDEPTEELWALRKRHLNQSLSPAEAEKMSDVWNVAFQREGLFPKLEAAKAIVETALAADAAYPILTNDGLIYDALSLTERQELVQHIRNCVAEADAPTARRVLDEFVVELLGDVPTV